MHNFQLSNYIPFFFFKEKAVYINCKLLPCSFCSCSRPYEFCVVIFITNILPCRLINVNLTSMNAWIGFNLSYPFPFHLLFNFSQQTNDTNQLDIIFTPTFVTVFCVIYFRISTNGEGNSCDILCDPSSIIGCKARININGCIPGLPADLAGNLFACRWACCCCTSKNDFPLVNATTMKVICTITIQMLLFQGSVKIRMN